ncbi:hypothetical protein [Psychroserpens sp.]|uniref:hypothetical protein n=1 Tax=Psychroserpens sp. TaxID=2020870 RepID=UPI001B059038|nr:hypothetical protein [Psychroserpens sp.]MBO6606396.1 hypothetical protein [Psychroserpens sp.]MBO6631283.1 hypothetical protein [Psychroserpens sp.]MBO6653100.1 hypothetical protein [Psychroserpens sp.]MBO6680872.1 hypothetical protein [Psychroserpens sp.]MBO6750170.1 hypothetical protein [Psychroserpens sp.]
MKRLIALFCFISAFSTSAQDIALNTDTTLNYLERHPIYDYTAQLTSVDTIPGYNTKSDKLKLSGTVYLSDGKTPAKDVIVYIEQADEFGNFDLKKHNDKRYVENRGWVLTDANGNYTFYTYIPGGDRRYKMLQQLFVSVKAPNSSEYNIESFLFNDDPLLTKQCRKKINKKGDPSRILTPKKEGALFVAQKDIILAQD